MALLKRMLPNPPSPPLAIVITSPGVNSSIQDFARFGIRNDGAHRHPQGDVVAGRSEHVRTHAMLTPLGIMAAGISKIDQRVQAHIGNGKDVASPAAVATVGTAEFLVFFVTKRDTAGTRRLLRRRR